MKIFRVILLTATAVGVGLSFSLPPNAVVVPVPGDGNRVNFIVYARQDGDYRAFVSAPAATEDRKEGDTQVTCSLDISAAQGNEPPIAKRTQTFNNYGRIYGMNLDLLRSDAFWRLHKGEITVRVAGTDNCVNVLSRGGSLTFEEDVIRSTELYLGEQLKLWGPRILAALGLIGLIMLEVMATRSAKGAVK
jgi:hypothetical protein